MPSHRIFQPIATTSDCRLHKSDWWWNLGTLRRAAEGDFFAAVWEWCDGDVHGCWTAHVGESGGCEGEPVVATEQVDAFPFGEDDGCGGGVDGVSLAADLVDGVDAFELLDAIGVETGGVEGDFEGVGLGQGDAGRECGRRGGRWIEGEGG